MSGITSVCLLVISVLFFSPRGTLEILRRQDIRLSCYPIIFNYIFVYIFLIFLFPALFISFSLREPSRIFKAQIFLFWTIVCLGFAFLIFQAKIAQATSRNFLLVLFYILLPTVIFAIYWHIHRSRDLKKLILVTLSATIILSVFGLLFDFKQWLLPFLIKKYILLGLTLSIVVGLAMTSSWFLFYRFLLWLVNAFIRGKRKIILKRTFAISLAVSCAVAILAYFWENKDSYKYITSRTKKDINIILIIIDALRADHLGCYGYAINTSPTIDSLAKEGVFFKNCYAATSYTKSSVASIMTSMYQTMHGMTEENHVLPQDLTTLAEVLKDSGYITCACVANPIVSAKYNYNQGFDFFQDNTSSFLQGKLYYVTFRLFEAVLFQYTRLLRTKEELFNRKIISWLDKYKRENFFMLIHYLDTHLSYQPQDERLKNISLYDRAIRLVDGQLREIFERLKSLKIYDKTVIIITADHGESLGERGYYGHINLYQEEIRVPLIIKLNYPLAHGKIIENQARGIDIMPTLLDFSGILYSGSMEGKNLLPLIRDEGKVSLCDYIFAEKDERDLFNKVIIKDNEWKLMLRGKDPSLKDFLQLILKGSKLSLKDCIRQAQIELYNLKTDPGESLNLFLQEPQISDELLRAMQRYVEYCKERAITPTKINLDKESIEQFRALGYLQ